ncbi:MAG: hypothetical protein ACUVS7_14410 [Bryobacteraceae bacterium]
MNAHSTKLRNQSTGTAVISLSYDANNSLELIWHKGSFATRFGSFAVPALGFDGNLGRNAFVGLGYAAFNLRLQRDFRVAEPVECQFIMEAFNLFNRRNVRAVNPNFQRGGEPLSAFGPRQVQLAVRLRF